MRHFLITNLYNMFNMGEILQLQALREKFPEDRITISSSYSFIDPKLCSELRVEVTGGLRPKGKVGLMIQTAKLTLKAILGADPYGKYDCIIDLGGDTFSDKPSPIYTIAHCLTLLPAAIIHKPYIICSQSIGPFKFTKPLAKFILKRASAVTARDKTTQQYLKRMGVKAELCHDLAYLCSRNIPAAKEFIGINPSAIAYRHMEMSIEEYTDFIIRLVKRLQVTHNVLLIPHVYGPKRGIGAIANVDDREIIEGVRQKTFVAVGTHKDISRCSLFIGWRMHACIRAISCGIPTVALGYSHKFKSLPEFSWIEIIESKQASIQGIIDAVEKVNKVQPDPDSLKSFVLNARGHIDTINLVEQEYTQYLLGHQIKCWTGHSSNEETRRQGASGGVTTELAKLGLSSELYPIIISSRDHAVTATKSLEAIQGGSFYCSKAPVSIITQLLLQDSPAIVIGLPCQISALQKQYPEHLYIGLFCSHSVRYEGIQLLLDHLKLKGDTIQYRYKHNGSSGMLINNETYVPMAQYWKKYLNYCFIPQGCLKCHDQTAESADISVGDAHGLPETIGKGLNIIIARTARGGALVNKAIGMGLLKTEEVNPAIAIKTQINYLRIKKGKMGIITGGYVLIRGIGNLVSRRPVFHPLIKLWLGRALKTEEVT